MDPLDLSPEAEALSLFPESFPIPPPLTSFDPAIQKGIYRTALRELAEEVGILATEGGTYTFSPEQWNSPARFYSFLKEKGMRLIPDPLLYWVNWVTPKPAPVRFDTHFFLLVLPPGIEPQKSAETVELAWFHPREALYAFSRGEIELMFPTYKSLEQLAPLKTLHELREFILRFPKLRIEPEVRQSLERGITIELPETWPKPLPWS